MYVHCDGISLCAEFEAHSNKWVDAWLFLTII